MMEPLKPPQSPTPRVAVAFLFCWFGLMIGAIAAGGPPVTKFTLTVAVIVPPTVFLLFWLWERRNSDRAYRAWLLERAHHMFWYQWILEHQFEYSRRGATLPRLPADIHICVFREESGQCDWPGCLNRRQPLAS